MHDVAILGPGLAGSTLAAILARQGPSVLRIAGRRRLAQSAMVVTSAHFARGHA